MFIKRFFAVDAYGEEAVASPREFRMAAVVMRLRLNIVAVDCGVEYNPIVAYRLRCLSPARREGCVGIWEWDVSVVGGGAR